MCRVQRGSGKNVFRGSVGERILLNIKFEKRVFKESMEGEFLNKELRCSK